MDVLLRVGPVVIVQRGDRAEHRMRHRMIEDELHGLDRLGTRARHHVVERPPTIEAEREVEVAQCGAKLSPRVQRSAARVKSSSARANVSGENW